MLSKPVIKVFGAFGCGNVGDDFIANIQSHYLSKHIPQASVRLVQQHRREEIVTSDVVIVGGGGLLYDYDMENVVNYTDILNRAQDNRIPSYLMGVGVQHIFSSQAKDTYKKALHDVFLISSRGSYDSSEIMKLDYSKSKIITSRDIGFLYEDIFGKIQKERKPKTDKKPILGLSFADWRLKENYNKIDKNLRDDYKSFRAYLKKILPVLNSVFDIKVIRHTDEDDELSREISALTDAEIVAFDGIEDSVRLVEVYKDCDYVITSRYHGLVASIIARVPVLTVAFNSHKAQRLIEDSFSSLRDQFFSVKEFVEIDVLSSLEQKSFLNSLHSAAESEYRKCVKVARRNMEIVRNIKYEIAKQG